MASKALVLDANILIRATLGQRVRRILESHAGNVSFFVPETAYVEAEEHLAALVAKRGGDPAKAVRLLRSMAALGTVVRRDFYADFEPEARKRLATRDSQGAHRNVVATLLPTERYIWPKATGLPLARVARKRPDASAVTA